MQNFSTDLTFDDVAMIFLTLYVTSEALFAVLFQCQPSGKMIRDGGNWILCSNCIMSQNFDVL